VALERLPEDWLRFVAEGGKMHLIMQVLSDDEDTARLAKTLKPLAMFRQGEVTDIAYRNGTMNSVRDWCKKVRDMGIVVGVGTHKPEVISQVEEEGWDVDFYAGCVYNRTRTREEWKQVLHGEIMEMENEIYVQSDPPRMYGVMRQTTKPCFAFKILAAGRIADGGIEQAFRTAFSSIKPNDGVLVGMFPRAKDEVRENAEIVHRILQGREAVVSWQLSVSCWQLSNHDHGRVSAIAFSSSAFFAANPAWSLSKYTKMCFSVLRHCLIRSAHPARVSVL